MSSSTAVMLRISTPATWPPDILTAGPPSLGRSGTQQLQVLDVVLAALAARDDMVRLEDVERKLLRQSTYCLRRAGELEY